MPAQPEWTPDEEATLRRLHADGHSYGYIAGALDCNKRFVAQKASKLGLTPNHPREESATDAVREKLAARREALADAALADCENLRERLWDDYTVVFNTPDGLRTETLELPDAKAVREFAGAIKDLASVHERLELIGKARASDVQKANLTVLFQRLAVAVEGLEL